MRNPEIDTAGMILDLERKLLDPNLRSSPIALSPLLADDFREFGISGRIYEKHQALQSIKEHPGADYTLSEFEVDHLHPDVVLATYHLTRSGFEGTNAEVTLRSSIWVRRSGAWQMLFHQGTIATP